MTKRWKINVSGKEYVVELDHNAWTNVQKLQVNEHIIYTSPRKLQVGGVTCFVIEGHDCAVIITNKMLGFEYDLVIDGVSAITQRKVKYQAAEPVATVVEGVVHQASGNGEK